MVAGKTALVTGAAKRIGRAIALHLAAEGYAIALHYGGSEREAEATAAEIRAGGGKVAVFQADFVQEDALVSLQQRVLSWRGAASVLVNNASVFERDEWDSVTRDSWAVHMRVNLESVYILSRMFAEALAGQKRDTERGKERKGVIVNMIDQRVLNLTPHFVSYSVSKYGVLGLTRSLALALAPSVRVMGIGLGLTLPSARQTEAVFSSRVRGVPLARRVALEEVCATISYILATPSLTGQMIALDAGEHLGWAQPNPSAQYEE